MKIYTGTDIIEIERVKNSIESIGKKFIEEIYTQKEIEYCESKKNAKYQHYAARLAAKEAIFKAVSKLLNNKFDISWKNAEIVNDENGRPYINLVKHPEYIIKISLSHTKIFATATAIIYKIKEN